MELYKKLLKRIEDGSPIYCNETFAKDLETIANKHFVQCAINWVVGQSEQLVCPHCKRKNIEIQHKSQSFKCKDCKEGWAN